MVTDTERAQQIARFLRWEEETAELCASGRMANQLIDARYFSGDRSLLLDSGQAVEEFKSALKSRVNFWRTNANRKSLEAWYAEVARSCESALRSADPLGQFRALVWLRHSTIPLLEEVYGEHGGATEKFMELSRILEASINSQSEPKFCQLAIVREFESTRGFLERNAKKIFGKIFRLDRAGDPRPRFIEVVESWSLEGTGHVTLCIPISIGCPNSCAMCDLGLFFGGNLTAAEMQRLIEINLEFNRGIPLPHSRLLTIFYLGGGDAALQPALPEVLRSISALYPDCRQVISTVGLDVDERLDSLVEETALIPGVGFQISICSLDDKIREQLVGRHKRTLSVSECVRLVEKFNDLSGRKGYLSIFLVKDLYDSVDSVCEQIRKLVDPAKVHITLTKLRKNETEMSSESVSSEKYRDLYSKLIQNGFETSISTNDEDPENSISCGVQEKDILSNNRIFVKNLPGKAHR